MFQCFWCFEHKQSVWTCLNHTMTKTHMFVAFRHIWAFACLMFSFFEGGIVRYGVFSRADSQLVKAKHSEMMFWPSWSSADTGHDLFQHPMRSYWMSGSKGPAETYGIPPPSVHIARKPASLPPLPSWQETLVVKHPRISQAPHIPKAELRSLRSLRTSTLCNPK